MALKDALTASEFFDALLPDEGYIFIVRFTEQQRRHIPVKKSEFIAKISTELSDARLETSQAIYFTPGSFLHDFVQTPTGRKKTGRQSELSAGIKSIFIDIDTGEGHRYKNKVQALGELEMFLSASGIWKPTAIVDSGRGIHCYWIFDEIIHPEKWLPVATAFKRVAKHHHFDIDPTCTADLARIMRLPGSLNKKTNPPSIVSVLGFSKSRIYSFDQFKTLFELPSTSIWGNAAENDDLQLPEEYRIPSYMEGVIGRCPLMKQVAEDHGSWCSEPLWKAVLQVAWYAKDGSEWIHTLSDGHPEYDFTATEEKFNDRANSLGPATCEQLAAAAEYDSRDFCSNCNHKGKIKSPIVLGNRADAASVISVDGRIYPRGYAFKQDGVYKLLEGDEQRIFSLRLDNLEVIEYQSGDEWEVLLRFNYWTDAEHTAVISQKLLVDKKALYQALVGQRLSIPSIKELEWFVNIMNSWIDTLRKAGRVQSEDAKPHFGWTDDGEFTIGGHIISQTDERPLSDRNVGTMAGIYTPVGELDTWKQIAGLFTGIPELEAIIASAFASPLLHFTNITGAIMSVVSRKSGVGKSSAMKVAQSVWGHPIKGVNALDDTEKSIFTKIGILHDLPAYWDELRGDDMVRRFSKMAFRLSQGKDMSRLNRNASLREVQHWQCLLTCASNTPLLDYLDMADQQSLAGAMRLLEFSADKVVLDKSRFTHVSMMLNKLEDNYGQAGLIYGRWLVRNRSAVEQALNRYIEQVMEALRCTHDERFWVVTVAVLLMGASIAKRLDLVDFDIPSLRKCLYDAVRDMRNALKTMAASRTFFDVLGSFLRENSGTCLVTDCFSKRGRGNSNKINIIESPRPGVPVTHRIAQTDNKVRIPVKIFTDWARDNGLTPRQLVWMAKEENAFLGRIRASVTSGTIFQHAREWCYEFRLHPLHAVSEFDVPVDDSGTQDLNGTKQGKRLES